MSKQPDFGQIFKMAQQVASQIEPPDSIKKGGKLSDEDMTKVIGQITTSVSKVITPQMVGNIGNVMSKPVDVSDEGMSSKKKGKQKMPPVLPEDSKISFEEVCKEVDPPKKSKKKRIVEIESDDEESDDDPNQKRTKDMAFTLSVTLKDLYMGTKKKLGIRRTKIDTDGSEEEEKKKLSVKIEPGMIDEHEIRFNRMADEKQGYETGDVVVTLDVEEDETFVRDGNNLLIEKEISLAECFNPIIYITHLDDKVYKIHGNKLDFFSDEDDMLKKVTGMGMPIMGEKGTFGDLFIRFKVVNNTNITDELVSKLNEIFPPIQKPIESEEIVDKEFELVTESDLEFFDSDEDSDDDSYDSDEDSYDSGESD